jgi:hypothetical protein
MSEKAGAPLDYLAAADHHGREDSHRDHVYQYSATADMMTAPKVGLFGWYMHGNFGDDVMAVMIARTLKSHGFRPVAYKLPRYLAEAESIEVADTLHDLTDGAAACVLGGGGLLVSGEEAITRSVRILDEEFLELTRLAVSQSIPVWGVSVGSTGAGRFTRICPGLARLLGSGIVHGMTLRLKGDKALADAFGIPSEHYPDIVFLASDFWPAGAVTDRKDVIATNRIGHLWAGRCLIKLLDTCGPSVFGLQPRHVSARHVLSPQDSLSSPSGRQAYQVRYTNIQDLSNVLCRARAIISTKLHIGVFAMSYGAAFYSYHGKAKTRAQLRELDLEAHMLPTRDIPRWLWRLKTDSSNELEATGRLVAGLKTRARGHLTSLISFLNHAAAVRTAMK